MQYFEYKIKFIIFKYVNSLSNLALACRNWSVIAKDPDIKFEWLIIHYGRVRALFHAVRLGPTFIDIAVCQTLIVRKVITSRYFVYSLIELKIDTDLIRAF